MVGRFSLILLLAGLVPAWGELKVTNGNFEADPVKAGKHHLGDISGWYQLRTNGYADFLLRHGKLAGAPDNTWLGLKHNNGPNNKGFVQQQIGAWNGEAGVTISGRLSTLGDFKQRHQGRLIVELGYGIPQGGVRNGHAVMDAEGVTRIKQVRLTAGNGSLSSLPAGKYKQRQPRAASWKAAFRLNEVEGLRKGDPLWLLIRAGRVPQESVLCELYLDDLALTVGEVASKWSVIRKARGRAGRIPAAELSASAYSKTHAPEKVADNNPGTKWSAEKKGAHLQFAFEEKVTLNQVELGFEQAQRKYAFTLQSSLNTRDWSSLGRFSSAGESEMLESFVFPRTPMRYLRLVSHGSSENAWMNLHTMIPGKRMPETFFLRGPGRVKGPIPFEDGTRIAFAGSEFTLRVLELDADPPSFDLVSVRTGSSSRKFSYRDGEEVQLGRLAFTLSFDR